MVRLSDGTLSKATVYVAVAGENDAVVITDEDLAGGVAEDIPDPTLSDPTLTENGTIAFSDDDLSDVHSASAAFKSSTHTGQLGVLTASITADTTGTGTGGGVTWSFSVANPAVQFLGAGDTITETYTVTVTDNQGSSVTRDVVVTITGANDAASIAVAAGGDYAVTEAGGVANGTLGDPSAAGDLDVSDVDDGEAKFATPTAAALAGAWTYTLDQALADGLTDGEVVSDTLTVSSFDGTASHDIVVTITGANDAPIAQPDVQRHRRDGNLGQSPGRQRQRRRLGCGR